MITPSEPASPATATPVPSVVADLHAIPLDKIQSETAATLAETLNRVLPPPEVQQVPVAAFNSSI